MARAACGSLPEPRRAVQRYHACDAVATVTQARAGHTSRRRRYAIPARRWCRGAASRALRCSGAACATRSAARPPPGSPPAADREAAQPRSNPSGTGCRRAGGSCGGSASSRRGLRSPCPGCP
ncbi:hypothetical protein CSE45_4506 [Citreicella sp. SE45]|nr:hypothetical protein CSE45_4506 [Citreicella sp. SE45]